MSSQAKSNNATSPRFGEWLRHLREEKGALQRTVAAAADMDVAVLSKIELGQRVPTEEQTAKFAKFFKVKETEAQGRRIAEKFYHENEGSPAAAREAIQFLAES